MMKRFRIGDGGNRLDSSEDESSLSSSLSTSPSKLRALFRRGRSANGVFLMKSGVVFVVAIFAYWYTDFARGTLDSSSELVVMSRDMRPLTTTTGSSAPLTTTGSGARLTAERLLSQPIDLNKCKVHQLSPKLVQSPNTVVTAYFRLKSKYNAEKYDSWMSHMLSIQDPVVVFTQSDLVDKIKEFRQHALNRTVIIESQYQDLPLSLMGDEFWQKQFDIDPEKRRHQSFQLFWIWLSKSWWTVQAIKLNYFHSHFYMWSDIGCFRNRAFNDKLVIQYPDVVPAGTILWMAHHAPNPPSTPFFVNKLRRDERKHFYHSGSQGAGTAQSWLDFHTKFATTLDRFIQKDLFVGEDQCVLQATCLLYPKMCAYAPFDQVNDNHYFGLRYLLHHGPTSAKNTPDQRYQLWRPPGWDS